MARRRRERMPLNAEINVVSLIDVMLILLVIFMLTAPMMQGGVDVALPKAEAKPLEPKSGLVITIDAAGAVHLDELKMSLSEFRSTFRSLAGNRTREGVYLRGDAGVPFGVVAQVLAIMNAAGVSDIGLVMEPEQNR